MISLASRWGRLVEASMQHQELSISAQSSSRRFTSVVKDARGPDAWVAVTNARMGSPRSTGFLYRM